MTDLTTSDPSAFSYQAPTSAPRPRSLVSPASVALALVSPAVTTGMLAVARYWSENGARHSIGDMIPVAAGCLLGLASAGYASATRDPLLTGTCLALSGACLGIGAMAYPTGMSEPLIVWGVATVTGWITARRHVRERRTVREEYDQRDADRAHVQSLAVIGGQTAVAVASIKAQAKLEAARIIAMAALKAADLRVDAAEFRAWQLESAERRDALMAPPPLALEPIQIDSASAVLARAEIPHES